MGQVQKVTGGRKPQVPSNRQNRDSKDLANRVAFPPPAYLWSCDLTDPWPFMLLVRRFGPSPDLSSPGMLLVTRVRSPIEGLESSPYAWSPQDNEVLTRIQYFKASAVFQLQAQKSSRTGQVTPRLTSGPAVLTHAPCPGASGDKMLEGHTWTPRNFL